MVVVNIAELKDQLSSYLNRVRRGEEVVIKDRNTPIARILPLGEVDIEKEEEELVAAGLLRPPKKKFDAKRFFAAGRAVPKSEISDAAIQAAIDFAKDDPPDVRLLGFKRRHTHLRSRSKK